MKERSLLFLKLCINYLQLVKSIADELITQGNKMVIITNYQITSEDFEERTKWSDYKIAEPLFFNFYHGLELLLKGYLLNNNTETLVKNHKIEMLYDDFLHYFSSQTTTINILDKYIGQNIKLAEPLKTFFTENNITVNRFYEALKYPESRKTQVVYNYDSLKYNGDKALNFYKQLKDDISTLVIETVSFGRSDFY
jgi:hypothetical protein